MLLRFHKKIGARLGYGFGIVVVLTIVLGITAIVKMNSLADITAKMYNHPLAVSNAVRDIRTDIAAMHRSMKDVVLTKNSQQLDIATKFVSEHEQIVLDSFSIVLERFSGNKHDAEIAYKAFIDWKPIRQEVIDLVQNGKQDEASEITKGKGAEHVAYMNGTIQTMSDFASNKAKAFFANAQDRRQQGLMLISFLLLLISVTSILVGTLVTRSITKPITYVMGEIGKLTKGNLNHRIRLERQDEIGHLVRTFNKMADSLSETTASRDELDAANQQLRASGQQLEAMNHELTSIANRLQMTNQELKDFVYIASHDLREPLRKISSFGELLRSSLEDKLEDDDKENLDFMIDGADRMTQMIEGLLSYSRLSSEKTAFETVDLNEIVQQLQQLELAATLEKTEGVIEVPLPLPSVMANPTQVRQLLQNLIANAMKYRREDTTPIVVVTARELDDERIRIEIQDNGIGIKEELQDGIFKMFKRLHSRQKYEGTGIGLAVCRKIIDKHGGLIGVDSKEGKGSVFWFTLPAARETLLVT